MPWEGDGWYTLLVHFYNAVTFLLLKIVSYLCISRAILAADVNSSCGQVEIGSILWSGLLNLMWRAVWKYHGIMFSPSHNVLGAENSGFFIDIYCLSSKRVNISFLLLQYDGLTQHETCAVCLSLLIHQTETRNWKKRCHLRFEISF